ncbi:hypothetical protein D3C84_1000990 [compost metagenome]
MLIVRSTLFLAAIEMAEILSAAPPITATNTIPINTELMPNSFPVPSAAPTSISLINAATTEATISAPTAKPLLQGLCSSSMFSTDSVFTLPNKSGCVLIIKKR